MLHPKLLALISVAIGALAVPASGGRADPADPTNPQASVPPTIYRPVLTGYEDTLTPSRATDWTELNERAERIGGPRGQLRGTNEPIRER